MPSQRLRTAVVVGAGPSGLAAAYLLHEAGWKVTLIERNSAIVDSSVASYSYFLMPHGLEAMRRMGLFDVIKKHAASARDNELCIIKRDEPVQNRSMSAFFAGGKPLFWVSRTALLNIMFKRVQPLASSGMDIRSSCKVTRVSFPESWRCNRIYGIERR